MTWPEASNVLDERALRSLLEAQFPEWSDLVLSRVDEGFDNVLWRLGEEYLVRLPRRSEAVGLLENEIMWLPELAPRLPLPVPRPLGVGAPSNTFPWPWVVTTWFEGTPGDLVGAVTSSSSAQGLGAFLRALHVPAPGNAPNNPWRGVPLANRADQMEERLVLVEGLVDSSEVRRVWREALDAPPFEGLPTWLHGDMHPANVIVRSGSLCAVVDFGDLCAGDPASDLAGAWMLLAPELLPEFLDAYGEHDEALIRRSLGWAALFGTMFVGLGLGVRGRSSYLGVGRRTLENVAHYAV
jgi:aminoglycoside phosphotransferase (APT) family kinase protein